MVIQKKIEYSERMRRPERAASYNTKYEREFHKRVSDRREKRLLASILEPLGRHERLLDVPCGAGRLSGVFSRYANHVFEVDYSRELARLCRANARDYEPLLVNATAFQLPFPDRSMDLIVSVRLSHHVPEHEERLKLLRELLRVSRRFVLFSFFDRDSLKNRMRDLGRKLGSGKRGKYTLSRADVTACAAENGFALLRAPMLSWAFSGHRFAVLHRPPSNGRTTRTQRR